MRSRVLRLLCPDLYKQMYIKRDECATGERGFAHMRWVYRSQKERRFRGVRRISCLKGSKADRWLRVGAVVYSVNSRRDGDGDRDRDGGVLLLPMCRYEQFLSDDNSLLAIGQADMTLFKANGQLCLAPCPVPCPVHAKSFKGISRKSVTCFQNMSLWLGTLYRQCNAGKEGAL
ncbi:hypothetical protein LIA77_09476 [Sarocladium implicatum]|nr:hypothetical protein LIA77_09476 [Sarocladium implicatum]